MKRVISFLICFALIFIMSACSGSEPRIFISEDASIGYEQVQDESPTQSQNQTQVQTQTQNQGTVSQQPNQDASDSVATTEQGSAQDTPDETRSNNPMVMGVFYRNVTGFNILSNDPAVREVDQKADAMLKKIEEYPDNINVSGRTYYISNSGDDSNKGLSPKKPKKHTRL